MNKQSDIATDETALRVDADSAGPSTASASWTGFAPRPATRATVFDHSIRL